ncbi:winged helix-turn-helix transcriptional regulator [Cohnella zeiphila]|uniref:Helix-turn-helix transcriptional regulator n=1 Tax=Cohnella zeiphila TaxID=2761120 RepID=A0A7X0SQ93_9BACL|nr:helix-turn-helix domain-containing protein [Cohnella zeiphila]MBB6733079.1 helix-turn-helix transcriptional regulator [Cohnella zeiphila]
MLQSERKESRHWPEAAVETTVQVVGGKWKGIILYHLAAGELRFNQIRRVIPGITQRMLTLQLRELERSGVVHRRVYSEMPTRVGYSLTELGRTLIPLISMMQEWGEHYLASFGEGVSD